MTIYGAFHLINDECSDKQTNYTITNTAKAVIRRIFCQRIVITLYNVCSVHRGMFSTSGVFSTSGGYHEYIGGDIMSTSGGYHDECGGIS